MLVPYLVSGIYHLSDINSNVGCSDTFTFKGEYAYKLLNPLVCLPFSIVHVLPFFDIVLDNAVAAQNFEYKATNILHRSLYALLDPLAYSPLTPTMKNQCLALSLCVPELSACIGTSRSGTTFVVRVCYRSTSSVKQWYVRTFFCRVSY